MQQNREINYILFFYKSYKLYDIKNLGGIRNEDYHRIN